MVRVFFSAFRFKDYFLTELFFLIQFLVLFNWLCFPHIPVDVGKREKINWDSIQIIWIYFIDTVTELSLSPSFLKKKKPSVAQWCQCPVTVYSNWRISEGRGISGMRKSLMLRSRKCKRIKSHNLRINETI